MVKSLEIEHYRGKVHMKNTIKDLARERSELKLKYLAPSLQKFGAFRDLTQSGSGLGTEGKISATACSPEITRRTCL